MRILNRIRRLLRANLNELLRDVESPENVVTQMIRDADAAILDIRASTAAAMTTHKLTARCVEETRREEKKWYSHAEDAVRVDNQALAREALTRRRAAQARATALEQRAVSEQDLIRRLKTTLRLAEEKIQELRAKRDTLVAKRRALETERRLMRHTGYAAADDPRGGRGDGGDASGFAPLAQMDSDLETEMAALEAREDLAPERLAATPIRQLQDLHEQESIEAELQRLKHRLR